MRLPTEIDGPVAVIGDIHGQVDKLARLLAKLETLPDYQERWIVFIGDYVDRGPDPKASTEMILQLMETHGKVTAICGNHELAMCGALHLFDPPEYAEWDVRWVGHYNAETTFAAYGAELGDLPALLEAMPESHRAFYSNLPWCVEHPLYLFVHAGLESHQPYKMQLSILNARDYSLTRPPWLCAKSLAETSVPPDCVKTVVSGHVYQPTVIADDRRLLIDTTGGTQGELSCVLLPEHMVITSAEEEQEAATPPPAPTEQQTRKPRGQQRRPAQSGWNTSSNEKSSWWKLW